MKFILPFIIMLIVQSQLNAQKTTDLAFEFQAYPTGIIPGLRLETQLGTKSTISSRLGFNIFDHRDLGVHDEETGNGYGFTIGYHQYFKETLQAWKWGIKLDYWKNDVDWVDNEINGPVEGMTEITVLQPTIELGYTWVSESSLFLTPTIAFGLEWNVRTRGEPTGEGPILLLGILAGKRF